ncbi:unnamed protein product [Brachionus calyciflorus]|uniref:Glycosyltransferase family 92 protein n=1 Tax=Brachionus calyciflorus TaxID=104777 RepID=A0A814Q227_9BILA|nr:unnamed protein product [Brachionus calyciflorus]
MKRKDLFLTIIFFSIIILFYYVFYYSYETYFHQFKKNDSEQLFKESQFSLIHEWTSNGKVCQYSTIVSKIDNKSYLIESVIFFNGENINMTKLKCFVKTKKKFFNLEVNNILIIKQLLTSKNVHSAYIISCNLDDFNVEEENFFVATIFTDDYKNNFDIDKLIIYQKSNFHRKKIVKKNSIIHCVHRFNRIDTRKFLDFKNWLKIQKLLGFDKIKIYQNGIDEDMKSELLDENKDFVELRSLETKFEDVCKYSLKNVKLYPNNSFFERELDYCTENHRKFIKDYLIDLTVEDAVNRLNMNDCLHNAKYDYDYLTNYDFDEFIFPRKYPINYFLKFQPNNNSYCNNSIDLPFNTKDYNIVTYANSLLAKYGPQTAFFEFSDFQPLDDIEQIKSQLLSISKHDKLVYNKFDVFLSIEFESSQQREFYENQTRLLQPFIDCLNKSIVKSKNLNNKWNNLYGVVVDYRQGKSIFLTNNTLMIHPHSALSIKQSARGIKIYFEEGNVIHLRERNSNFKENKKPNKFSIDLEYYIVLKNLFTSKNQAL